MSGVGMHMINGKWVPANPTQKQLERMSNNDLYEFCKRKQRKGAPLKQHLINYIIGEQL